MQIFSTAFSNAKWFSSIILMTVVILSKINMSIAQIVTPLFPPSNCVARALSSVSVRISWRDNSAKESGYVIRRSDSTFNFITADTVDANVTVFIDSGLLPKTTYFYRIFAFNNDTQSDPCLVSTKTCPDGGEGDVNGDTIITPGDALCAFKIFLNNQIPPSDCDVPNFDCEVVAADPNCDGTVTPGDALVIFQRFLDRLPPDTCFAKSLLFTRDSQMKPYQIGLSVSTTDQVNEIPTNDFVKVSLIVDNPKGLKAFGLKLLYPPEKLEFIEIKRSLLTANWIQLGAVANIPGQVTLGGFDKQPLGDVGQSQLCEVIFASKGNQIKTTDFQITDLVDDFIQATVRTISLDDVSQDTKSK